MSDDRTLNLRQNYRFNSYTGIGGNEFDLVFSIEWTLGSERVSRRASIGETPIPQLENSITYSELDTRSTEIDHTVAEIIGRLMMRIDALSRE